MMAMVSSRGENSAGRAKVLSGSKNLKMCIRDSVHTGQVGVQIAGIAAASGDLLLGGGDLAQRLGVVGAVSYTHLFWRV